MFRVQGLAFRVEGSGFRVQGSRFSAQGSGFRVQGLGFRVQGSGFMVQGLGFRIKEQREEACQRSGEKKMYSAICEDPPGCIGMRVQDFGIRGLGGFRVQSWGFRVEGSGFGFRG